ncbi:MAG: four-carbon acid sugar kinase family protein, partial [Candidatus Rokuibacteriota bacterium]
MTTLPRCSARWKFAPPGVGTVKSSASFGRAGLMRSSSLIASATGRARTRRGRAAAVAATSGAAGAGGTAARSDVAGVVTPTARSSASRDSTVKKPTAAAADTATTAITTAGSGRIESRAVYLYIEPPPMKPTRSRPLTIVADDLTGACDTGALFTARAPVPVSVWPRRPPASAVTVVDTESRTLTAADAAERLTTVATGGRARQWFK